MEIGRHRYQDTPAWAALSSYGRRSTALRATLRGAIVLSAVGKYMAFGTLKLLRPFFYVLLFQLLLIIIEGMFLNTNFPEPIRNQFTEWHRPFPLSSLYSSCLKSCDDGTSFILFTAHHAPTVSGSCLHVKHCINTY